VGFGPTISPSTGERFKPLSYSSALAPGVGIKPTTFPLTADCSISELPRITWKKVSDLNGRSPVKSPLVFKTSAISQTLPTFLSEESAGFEPADALADTSELATQRIKPDSANSPLWCNR
jgi:hypothetical protein